MTSELHRNYTVGVRYTAKRRSDKCMPIDPPGSATQPKPRVRRNWRQFSDARLYARSLGLNGQAEWFHWSAGGTRPRDIPSDPSRVYKNEGWLGWPDWLDYAEIPFSRYQETLSSDEESVMIPAFRCPRSLRDRLDKAPGGNLSEKLRAAVEQWLQAAESASDDR